MKKKILAAIAAGLICVSASGCGTKYQEAVNISENNSFGKGYFTVITHWHDIFSSYYIVYANDTKVKYFAMYGDYESGITPLYNANGTLQVYDGE